MATKQLDKKTYSKATTRARANDQGDGATDATTGSQEAPKPLGARVVKQIDAIREAFNSYTSQLAAITERRAEFAPKFMKVFHAWQAETKGTFVAFVRVLVPELPMDTKGYKGHVAHIAADNLRTLYNRLERAKAGTPVERAQAIANKPVAPRAASVRLIAGFLGLLDANALEALKRAMQEQLHWSEAVVDGFITEAGEASPLVRVRPPKGINIEHALKLTPGRKPATEEEAIAA